MTLVGLFVVVHCGRISGRLAVASAFHPSRVPPFALIDAFLWWFSPPPLACRSRKRAEKALGAAGADDAAEMYRNQVICLKVPPPFGAIGGNREMRTKKMVKYENAAQRPNKCTVHFWTTMPYALWSFFLTKRGESTFTA